MARAGFEFSEFLQFRDRMQGMLDEHAVDGFIREVLLDLAKKLVVKTKRRTPKNTGLLQNSWMIGNVVQNDNSYEVEVYTDIEYANFIENGFRAHWVPGEWVGNQFVYDKNAKTGMQVGKKNSWVPGKFMLTISAKEIERELPAYLQKKQLELLKKMMGGR